MRDIVSDQEAGTRKLAVFNSISLDGYFTDHRGDMSWAHTDKEWNDFVQVMLRRRRTRFLPRDL
jgi:hypothetical protein